MNRPAAYFFKISNYKRHFCPLQPLSYALDNSGRIFLNYANIFLIANVNLI